jgi:regulator of sigma E protease
MQTLIYLLLALSLLIVVHEYGHFWVARRCGVKVLRFSIGFGKPLWQKVGSDGTEYVIAPFLLGGYVKMLDEREGEVVEAEQHRSFNRQNLIKRAAIVAAGPIANFLFALIAYWLLFTIGIPGIKPVIGEIVPASIAEQSGFQLDDEIVAIDGHSTPIWSEAKQILMAKAEAGGKVSIEVTTRDGIAITRDTILPKLGLEKSVTVLEQLGLTPLRPTIPAVIGEVIEGKAADLAGIEVGDELVTVGQQNLTDWMQWVELIRSHPEKPLEVSLMRNGLLQTIVLTPQRNEQGEGVIGAAPDATLIVIPDSLKAELRYDALSSIPQALSQVWFTSISTLKGLGGMLIGTVSSENLGGLITIAQIAKSSADQGWGSFVNFLAMISVTLAVLNLLPIPVLDGGHLAWFVVEWLTGKPVSESLQMQAQQIGLILLIGLMMLAFYNDLTRLFG